MLAQDGECLPVLRVDDRLDLRVYLRRHLVAVIELSLVVAPQEHFLRRAEVHVAYRVGHAPFRHHLARDLACALDVVGRACGDVFDDQLFRGSAAQHHGYLIQQFLLREMVVVVLRQSDGVSGGLTAGDDAHFVHGVAVFGQLGDDGVAGLVVCRDALVALGHHAALLRGARDDLVDRLGDVLHGDELAVGACGEDCCLVEQVLDVRSREARCQAGKALEVDRRRKRLVAAVHLEYLLAPFHVGDVDVDLSVESAGTHERGIEYIRAVGRRHDDDAVVGLEAVHLDEQLVERLFTLVVAAAEPRAALASHGVDFVDEDYARHAVLRLIEEVAHSRRAHTHEHLDEVRTADGEEGNVRLSGNGFRKQRLARSGRADEQHAFGNARAYRGELLGVFEEFDYLLQFLLFLFRAGDVGEAHFTVAHLGRFGLAEVERLVVRAVGLAHYDEEHNGEQHDHDDGHEQGREHGRAGRIVEVVRHVHGVFELARGVDRLHDLVHVRGAVVGVIFQPVFAHETEIYAVRAVEIYLVYPASRERRDEVAVYDVIGTGKTDREDYREQDEDDHGDDDYRASCRWFHFTSRTPRIAAAHRSARRAKLRL